ncbi:hypothetical protein [Bacteroides sp.]|uniref:phage tail assembly chaperone n=1 Tax=Bacteroides sp. TaxID=29523 RepID=UPI00261979BB|nr:hypothetical protein [Bacteroides sp.]MDD3039760.1 hypothetical protein [Bacteroides sp.]
MAKKETSNLSFVEFFKGRDIANLTKEVLIKGIPTPFVIRAVTKDEFAEYSKVAKSDGAKLMELMVINNTVEPNFKSATLLEQFGVTNPKDLLGKVLLSGEFYALAEEISKLSEFDLDINKKVEQAKN